MQRAELETYRAEAQQTAELQRQIQREVERRDKPNGSSKSGSGTQPKQKAVNAGERKQPANPLPAQHLAKPGDESDLDPRPNFTAPGYLGSEKLKGKVALITGGDSGIGRAVAVLFAREGADVAIIYLNEHADAEITRRAVEKEGTRCIEICGDVRDPKFCSDAVEHVVQQLGQLNTLVNKVPDFGATTDFKRPAQPEEIAPAYVFLAAPSCSSYITGIELPIMGGVHGSG